MAYLFLCNIQNFDEPLENLMGPWENGWARESLIPMLEQNKHPVVQSIISLTSSLGVKMLNVLVSTISNSQVFLLKKWKLLSFFSKNISMYAIFNDQSFNDTLTNVIVSFEQLDPDCLDCL